MGDRLKLSEPIRLGKVTVPNRVFVAPMSGVTDAPFRRRGLAHGAGLAVSEMIASGELTNSSAESLRRMRRDAGASNHIVQLAGRDPRWMAEAARMAEAFGADLIDINMGCPAKKVTGGYAGSALMREPEQALRIIDAVAGAVNVPVTVKMRLGWDDSCLNAAEIARAAENSGIAMITVHGRTRCQFYKGRANWRAIKRVKSEVKIPVVANGDVETAADANAILEVSGADAVMIGRGHYGQPWLAGSIARDCGHESGAPAPRSSCELAAYIITHYEDMLEFYGTEKGLRHARKHLGWYIERQSRGLSQSEYLEVMRSNDPRMVVHRLKNVEWGEPRRQTMELAA